VGEGAIGGGDDAAVPGLSVGALGFEEDAM
jgi:hypothetical protein